MSFAISQMNQFHSNENILLKKWRQTTQFHMWNSATLIFDSNISIVVAKQKLLNWFIGVLLQHLYAKILRRDEHEQFFNINIFIDQRIKIKSIHNTAIVWHWQWGRINETKIHFHHRKCAISTYIQCFTYILIHSCELITWTLHKPNNWSLCYIDDRIFWHFSDNSIFRVQYFDGFVLFLFRA